MSSSIKFNIPGQALPELYDKQLSEKVILTQQDFENFGVEALEIFPSPPAHYRMRAEFKVWHDKEGLQFAMYEPGKYKSPTIINEFSIGSNRICQLMPILMKEINNCFGLRHKLFQLEFLTSTVGDALISMIYHRPLDQVWIDLASKLEKKINAKVIGRSRKQKVIISDDYVEENFNVNNKIFKYRQYETGFTQPNAAVCQNMLNWADNVTKNVGGDLVELYCGNGNFTLPLSINYGRVIATEISKISIQSALHNASVNNCHNIDIVRMSSEDFVQAMNKVRPFRRLAHLNLSDFQFSTIFIDPPRAGLDDNTLSLVQKFNYIVYISCNPETLHSNLSELVRSHKIERFALFDQFPYTNHRECGVFLRRNH